MDWMLDKVNLLLLLLVIPLLILLMRYFIKWKKRKQELFGGTQFQDKIWSSENNAWVPILYVLGFLFLIFAMVDVIYGSTTIKTKEKNTNIIFLLDVSKSMNAEDVSNSRLTLAKNIIYNSLEKLKGDRVGLVVFAGEAQSIMPMTTDYLSIDTYLQDLETSIVSTQGTDFLLAMETTVEKFKNVPKGARNVILISDGEDNEGNEDAAKELALNEGISVITVGVGTEEGSPIPEYLYGQLMGYKLDNNGETVITNRQENALKEIANKTNGIYVDGNNLDQSSNIIVKQLQKSKETTNTYVDINASKRLFPFFTGISFIIFSLLLLFNPKKDFNI